MGIKKYIIAALLLLIVIAGFIFSLQVGDYRLQVFSYSLNMPVFVWFIIPYILLLIVSIIHMLYHGAKSYLFDRAVENDKIKLYTYIKILLLQKDEDPEFKTRRFKDLAQILAQFTFDINVSEFKSSHKDLNEVANMILDIKDGTYIPNKKLKLSEDNLWAKKNLENKIASDMGFCEDILKRFEAYSKELVKKAFLRFLEENDTETLIKINKKIVLDKCMLFALLEKNKNEKYIFEDEELKSFLSHKDMLLLDCVKFIKLYKAKITPDKMISLFEELSNKNEELMQAYVYVLFEFEMIEKAEEFLNNANENDYMPFRALLELKKQGKQYSMDNISYK